MKEVMCPATMCPLLVGKKGSPWTTEREAKCPQKGGFDRDCECPWWDMACGDNGHVKMLNKSIPFLTVEFEPKSLDCSKSEKCSWQQQAGDSLCAPRLALSKGINPKHCIF